MDLSELFGYCRGLDADKVTDRKKNVEKLRLMLNKSYVLQCLDKNTDMKISGASTSRNLTWDDVFKSIPTGDNAVTMTSGEAINPVQGPHQVTMKSTDEDFTPVVGGKSDLQTPVWSIL
ncbi:hypothetical protein ScPMuIL_012260 [Solemya velum]